MAEKQEDLVEWMRTWGELWEIGGRLGEGWLDIYIYIDSLGLW